MDAPAFGSDYGGARRLFREAAVAAGASVESIDHSARGPDGGALATDVALLGPPDADRVLALVSGTHGVEGYCGSAAQVAWLQRGEGARLGPRTAALLIHAINPYGFAWHRRVTHENVDLNRNWVDFAAPLPENPGYDELADALVPRDWHGDGRRAAQATLQGALSRLGLAALAQAISAGQYAHPAGLFYGGRAPTESRATLTRIFEARLARASRVAILDFHTGLGPKGLGELMTSEGEGSPALERARRWFGARVIPVGTGGSASARIGGDWIGAVPSMLPHATVTAVALEFGTVDALHVLEALRADHWLHAHGDPAGPGGETVRRAMRDAFYVDDNLWRGMVLGQALAVCREALHGLEITP